VTNPGAEARTPAAAASGVEGAFARRAERAGSLAGQSSSGAALLDFAAGLYRAQGALASAIERAQAGRAFTGILERDLPGFAGQLDLVLAFAADKGPAPLAETARTWRQSDCGPQLQAFWGGERSGRQHYLQRALLRPYVEVLAALGVTPEAGASADGCRFCGGAPWIACRRPRAAIDGDGAQRVLGCALCGGEWVVNRICCPACDEQNPDKLPCFQSDRHPAVRVEACATCRGYLKSIDLAIDGRAIPEVDDLLSLSMDLWAGEEGYARLEPGLAGI
jgi:formate dehydrogenase maturation protein FdhE